MIFSCLTEKLKENVGGLLGGGGGQRVCWAPSSYAYVSYQINIGIIHGFSCIDIGRFRGNCLNTRRLGRVFKLLSRDPANVTFDDRKCQFCYKNELGDELKPLSVLL